MYGRDATNDRSESAIGGTTHQQQKYGHIGIANAAAVSDAMMNDYFRRCLAGVMKGMFHQFDLKMCECLLTMAIEDAPDTISTNRDNVDKQQEAKRKKEEMIEKKSLDKAKEDLVEASYYWEMYNSDVCWKGKQSIVGKMLGRLKLESAKLEALKENIRMHGIGLGWKQFAITWSHRCKVIGARAGGPFKNDYQGRKEADATKESGNGDAKAFGATNIGDCNTATDGEQYHC